MLFNFFPEADLIIWEEVHRQWDLWVEASKIVQRSASSSGVDRQQLQAELACCSGWGPLGNPKLAWEYYRRYSCCRIAVIMACTDQVVTCLTYLSVVPQHYSS